MIISVELLLSYGADCDFYPANSVVFSVGSPAKYYYQIVSGTIELINYHEDGRQFTFNILSDGQCFGESLLFSDKRYPMTAKCCGDCNIIKLTKKDFLKLFIEHPEVSLNVVRCMSDSLYHKYTMLFSNSSLDPSFKIKTVLDYLKAYNKDTEQNTFEIPLTRQQIADLTGLRVETVIRAIKKMEVNEEIKIEGGKIYY